LTERYEDAVGDLDRAIELSPDYAWAIAIRGETYCKMERYEQAIEDLDRAVELRPDSEWVIASRGKTYRLMGRFEEALGDFDRAVQLCADGDWILAGRGEIYRLIGRYEDAIRDFDRAIELDPDYYWAIVSRGRTYRSIGRDEEAIRDFGRAIGIEPERAWAITQRGAAYRLVKQFDKALSDLNHAIELDPEYAWAFDERGRVHRAMGHYAESVADFDQSMRLDPLDAHLVAERVITSGIEHRGSNAYQCVVDVEASPWEAASLARSLTRWLISSDIIQPQLSDCGPDGERGHAPGPSYERATGEPGQWAGRCHGVMVEYGRSVCPSGAMRAANCPSCEARIQARQDDRPTAEWESLNDAILRWERGGTGTWNCPECHEPAHLNDWEIDPPWAVGNLVALFWNWPPLREEFIADIRRILGHHVAVISGTI
jgi:tetratricopeptide (TPR) repeat protein